MKLTSIDISDLTKLMQSDVESTMEAVFGITESRFRHPEDVVVIRVGELEIIFDMCILTWRGEPVELSVKCLRIVHRLALRPGVVKTRAQLLDEVQDRQSDVYDRTIDSHIKRIRAAFRKVDPDFDAIESLYGMGWRWRREAAPIRSIAKP
jgi:DNA-binding response OmpR family regulator